MKSLIPWRRPNREISHFRKDKEDFFDRFFREPMFFGRSLLSDAGWYPSADVSEGKKDIIVKAELPGVDRKDIDISLDGRFLTIKGEKSTKKKNLKSTIIASKVHLDIIRERLSCQPTSIPPTLMQPIKTAS